MAIVACRECKNAVSTEAAVCMHCGAKVRRKTHPFTWLVLFCIILFVYLMYAGEQQETARVAALTPQQMAAEEAEKKLRHEDFSAAYTCLNVNKRFLNDPDSAKFPDEDDVKVTRDTTGVLHAAFVGRAKNAFNAYIAQSFSCDFKLQEDGTPKLIKVNDVDLP